MRGFFYKAQGKLRDFIALSKAVDTIYLSNITAHNAAAIAAAAILTIIIECTMTIRLFISHPAIDTPASRVYLTLYLSLTAVAGLYFVVRPRFQHSISKTYWLQFTFVSCYLLWNVLLNSYDLYRNQRGSSLALVAAILFASILVQFRPRHIMILQSVTFLLFFLINYHRIEDKINATIVVLVAVVANLLFYLRDIQNVHNRQRIAQMDAHLEKEQMDGAMQYLRRLQESQTQTAIYHHDLRHTLHLIEQYTLQGNLEKIQEFVSASQESLHVLTPTFFCQHETANLILGSFHQRATQKNIAFQTEIRLTEHLSISDTELCSLLCNLLENAMHGAAQVEDSPLRHIYIKAVTRDDKLVILVENGFVGEVVMHHNRPVTQSHDKYHGFGIQSIIDITKRHQGLYVFETEKQRFRAKILIHLNSGN